LKKSKIVLLYSFYILVTIYVVIIVNNNIYSTKYKNELKITGIINDYELTEEYLKIELLAKEKIICFYYINNDYEYLKKNIKLGIKITLNGNLEKVKNNTNFNLFNYKKYLLSKKIYWTFKANKYKIIINKVSKKYEIKNLIIKRINKSINKEYLNMFILGKNNLDEMKDIYQKIGISHIFAVSGMHITLLTAVIYKLINKISKKRLLNLILLTAFLIFYIFLTNYQPSILRAVFLFIFIEIKKILKINIKNINILLIIMYCLLIYNPYYIFDLGFLFSFSISISLIKYNKLISTNKNYFMQIIITSIISFLFSLPIIMINIYQINLITPITNCIFIPFVSFIIFPLSQLSFFLPILDILLNKLIILMELIAKFFDKINFLVLNLPSTNIFIIILYFLVLIFIFNNFKFKKLIILIIMIFMHTNIHYFNKYPIVTLLDVGQGDSILLELQHNKGNILIDTGGNYNNDLGKKTLLPYFKSIGIKKIDYLIITHGDNDHIGSSKYLINNFKIDKVIFNCGTYNDLEKDVIKELDKKNIKYYSCIKEINIDKYKLQFLNNKEYDNENDNSNVIYIELNNYKFLFMGDAGKEVEKDILEKYNLKNIDFLKVGHHGSNTSSSENFINSISPKYSLISVGENNRFGHPRDEVLDILKNSKIYRTDLDGSIEIKLNKIGYKIRTCSP